MDSPRLRTINCHAASKRRCSAARARAREQPGQGGRAIRSQKALELLFTGNNRDGTVVNNRRTPL